MKRGLSDSDSDCDDDVFDDSIKAGSPSQSCQISDRKRRRGVIEKRRRDRINSSLTELRRLVPSAFEKQGSAKLEKAEILQMTVDHLKMLHQKGLNSYNYDPHSLAKDYRYVGYRECASEVARYLVAVEGLELQDPLRMRLLSHLQCFTTQREVKAAPFQCGVVGGAAPPPPPLPAAVWNGGAPHPMPSFNPQYNSAAVVHGSGASAAAVAAAAATAALSSGHFGSGSLAAGSLGGSGGGGGSGSLQTLSGGVDVMGSGSTSSSLLNSFSADTTTTPTGRGLGANVDSYGTGLGGGLHSSHHHHPHHQQHQHYHHQHHLHNSQGGSSTTTTMPPSSSSSLSTGGSSSSVSTATASMSPSLLHSLSMSSQFHHHSHHTPQFPGVGQSLGVPPSSSLAPYVPGSHHSVPSHAVQGSGLGVQQGGSGGMKPYRPWGGELAY